MKSRFKLWNKVTWCGLHGVIVDIRPLDMDYPIGVQFYELNNLEYFTRTGKYYKEHKKSSLKKVLGGLNETNSRN